jgi:hypothetical protein
MDDIQTFLTYPTKQELNKIKNAAKKVRQSASSFLDSLLTVSQCSE